MKCMSCQLELGQNAKFWDAKVLLCPSCHALAESLTTNIDKQVAQARGNMMQWLERHILQGGLLRDPSAPMSEVPPPQGGGMSQPSGLPEGDDPSPSGLWPARGLHSVQGQPPRGDK